MFRTGLRDMAAPVLHLGLLVVMMKHIFLLPDNNDCYATHDSE
jgi:hypothetical protein